MLAGEFPVISRMFELFLTFSLGDVNFLDLRDILLFIVILKNFPNRGVARIND